MKEWGSEHFRFALNHFDTTNAADGCAVQQKNDTGCGKRVAVKLGISRDAIKINKAVRSSAKTL